MDKVMMSRKYKGTVIVRNWDKQNDRKQYYARGQEKKTREQSKE